MSLINFIWMVCLCNNQTFYETSLVLETPCDLVCDNITSFVALEIIIVLVVLMMIYFHFCLYYLIIYVLFSNYIVHS